MKPPKMAAAALSAMLLMSSTPASADRLEEVKARGKIIVGVSDTTPPFTFKRPGGSEHVGYDIDLVRAVAKRLGVAVETVSLASAERIPMLQQGKLDFVATSMTRTPERLRDVDFSVIYFVTPHAVIVRKASGITSVHQLAGRKAASASASTAGANLKEVVPGVDILYVRDYAAAFAALKDEASTPSPPTRACCARSCSRTDVPTTTCFFPTSPSRATSASLEEGRAALQGRHQPRAARYRGVGRGRQDLRRLVRPGHGAADAAQVQDPAGLKLNAAVIPGPERSEGARNP